MNKAQKIILTRFLIINLSALIIGVSYGILAEYFILNFPENTVCLFKDTLHFYCPGCGGSRSVISLIHLDFLSALRYYPPTLLCILFILIMDVFDITAFVNKRKTAFNFKLFYLVLIAVILQFFVRNILLLLGIDIIGDIF